MEVSDQPQKQSFFRFGPITAILSTLLIYFGAQILAVLLLSAAVSAFGSDPEAAVEALESSPIWQFVFIVVTALSSLLFLKFFMNGWKISWSTIGLGRKPSTLDLGRAAIAFGIYFVILIVIIGIVDKIFPIIDLDQKQQLGFENVTGAGNLALVFVSLVILPPIVEEIIVRGYLYSGLRKGLKVVVAALVTSFVFGIAHLQLGSGQAPLWVAAIDTFVLSVVLIALREKTGALWSGMYVHGIKNFIAFVSLFILASA